MDSVRHSLDQGALGDLFPLVYHELRQIAAHAMAGEGPITISATALVDEAYSRLANSPVTYGDKEHLRALAALEMRRILVDEAKRRKALKRGGDWTRLTWSPEIGPDSRTSELDLEVVDRAVERLAAIDEREARIVELLCFGGMTIDQVAKTLGVSPRTVDNDWSHAKAWLRVHLEGLRDGT